MTTLSAGQPAPPPYFDDDEMLEDYIDDDDFGGPPPPTTNNTTEPSRTEDDKYDEEYWEDMMEMEVNQSQSKQQEPTATVDSPQEPTTTADSPDVSRDDTGPEMAPEMFEEKNNENQIENTNNNTTVEEYLAARREENNLYNFERYKKNKDWRTSASSSSDQHQLSNRHQRHLGLSKDSRNSSTKRVAPEARFLRLLEANRGAHFYNKYSVESAQLIKTNHRLLLDRRSSKGDGINIFRSPPKESHTATVPMTLADGNRVFIRSGSANNTNSASLTSHTELSEQSMKSCALGVSMKELFRRVDVMRHKNITASRKRIKDFDTEATSNNDADDSIRNRDDMLWVDKHAPKAFSHLLSDERTNRDVLRALRGWDPYVFRKAPMPKPLYERLREQRQQEEQQKNGNKTTITSKNQINNKNSTSSNASDKRPDENARVILLSGPPGVGKTTLAHIVARHAGYRPVEVNASDERSSGVLKDRIQRAMESTTINFKPSINDDKENKTRGKKTFGSENDYGKPNCLILDEIDGADARGSIQALVDIVKAEIPSKTKQKQSTTSATYLRRPIICICNHKYAPALRPLLPYALHFNVKSPSSKRLVSRLQGILSEEKMTLLGEGSLLHQLVVSSGGDIRSCLFTLQFAAAESKDSRDFSKALTNSLSGTGLKDNRNDIASTISAVFRKMKSESSSVSTSFRLSSSKDRDRASVSRVMNAIDSLGDDSAALNALFMNVLRVSYIDPSFDRCSAAHELLSFAAVAHNQQSGYSTPVVTAGIHLLCRVEVKPNLIISSRELTDNKYRRESNLGLVQKFCEGLPAKAKNLKCKSLLAKEFIPLVMWILSAGNGPASLSRAASSIDILTKKEQDAAKKHVETLYALGLTYIVNREEQEKRIDGPSHQMNEMRLEPPIDRLVEYTALRQRGTLCRNDIPSKMKELLAHEVLLESFRKRDSTATKCPIDDKEINGVGSKATPRSNKQPVRNSDSLLSPTKVTPRKLDQLATNVQLNPEKDRKVTPSPKATAGNFLGIAARKGKAAKSARRVAASGLSRLSSKKQKLAHSGSGFLLSHVVRMKYVKGFTQAVRTPCRLHDLE